MSFLEEKIKFIERLLSSNEGWTTVSTEQNIVTKSAKIDKSSIECFMSYGLVKSPINKLVNYLWKIYDNIEGVKIQDADVVEYSILENIDNGCRVCRQVNHLPWPLWSRESVYAQYVKQIDSNRICIVMYSVNHNAAPVNLNSYVRTNINISAIYLEKIDQHSTKVYRIAHVDPSGYIPSSITNTYVYKTRELIKHLQKNDEKIC